MITLEATTVTIIFTFFKFFPHQLLLNDLFPNTLMQMRIYIWKKVFTHVKRGTW